MNVSPCDSSPVDEKQRRYYLKRSRLGWKNLSRRISRRWLSLSCSGSQLEPLLSSFRGNMCWIVWNHCMKCSSNTERVWNSDGTKEILGGFSVCGTRTCRTYWEQQPFTELEVMSRITLPELRLVDSDCSFQHTHHLKLTSGKSDVVQALCSLCPPPLNDLHPGWPRACYANYAQIFYFWQAPRWCHKYALNIKRTAAGISAQGYQTHTYVFSVLLCFIKCRV